MSVANSPAARPGTASVRRAALEAACRTVAPAWPIDRQVAVSPYWGYRSLAFGTAAERLRRLCGTPLTWTRAQYLCAWRQGQIRPEHLQQALSEQSAVTNFTDAVRALEQPAPAADGLPLLSDRLDSDPGRRGALPWRERITQQISETCAAYFDRLQSDGSPARPSGLFEHWRAALRQDRRFASVHARAAELPQAPEAAFDWALERLAVRDAQLAELLEVLAARIGGWAAWCAYLRWEASLAGEDDVHLAHLLVIRLAWEALLHDGRHDERSVWRDWLEHWNMAGNAKPHAALAVDLLWQRAHEIAYQASLFSALRTPREAPSAEAHAQLVFCIDVRSERMRRALEQVDEGMRTYGFAGFFGLPLRYTPLGTSLERPQLPALLAPSLTATDTSGDAAVDDRLADQRRRALRRAASLEPFARMPTGAFSTVEILGLSYLPKLLARTFGRAPDTAVRLGLEHGAHAALRPRLSASDPHARAEQAQLAARILRAMGIERPWARLLVLVGHGARTANNPQAAALACGACGGHSGDVNARILADLLNDPAVRRALGEHGVELPEHTVVIAALHDTVTDTVELFAPASLPEGHAADLQRLRDALQRAAAQVRRERAPELGLAHLVGRDAALLRRLKRRTRDWSEVRPEWGLAGNAAFILAPRARTRGIDLKGRAFLHEYRPEEDPDGTLLEQVLAGPLVVAHWINLQYFGSTVDPQRFGSGDKLLHNVLGGRIGVLEGHSGDLRIGLARQSVHDGTAWRHAPLRLTVLIDAPRERIERVVQRLADVRQLVEHEWLYLYRLHERGPQRLLASQRVHPDGLAQAVPQLSGGAA
ncbi:MAG: YbcC family protein [Steroidobacteraceae bacterium]